MNFSTVALLSDLMQSSPLSSDPHLEPLLQELILQMMLLAAQQLFPKTLETYLSWVSFFCFSSFVLLIIQDANKGVVHVFAPNHLSF